MLSSLKKLGLGAGNAPFAWRSLPLHAMPASCGYALETSCSYDWHGLKRGEAELALIQYTLDGSGMLSYEGREQRLIAGKAMLLYFPFDNRYWLPPDSPKWEFLFCCLYGSEIMRIWREIAARQAYVMEFAPDSPVVRLMVRLIRKVRNREIKNPFEASADAYQLGMAALACAVAARPAKSRPLCVRKAVDYCRAHFRENIGVDDIVRVAGYSRYHFSRQFKQYTGYAPGEYVMNLRIRHSLKLLKESTRSIKEISSESGFRDTNYFCRCFRANLGISPGAYRQSGMF